jgi:hypothetical protein
MRMDERLTSDLLANKRGRMEVTPAVDPAKDLNPHRDGSSDGDSFYIVSYLQGGGLKFTVLFHMMLLYRCPSPPAPCALLALSVLDEDNLEYFSREISAKLPELTDALDIVMPTGHLSGTIDALTIEGHATDESGKPRLDIKMTLKAMGLTLPDLGAGVIPFADGQDYEYAFPRMATCGTLTVKGELYNVTGTSWLDREWGKFGPSKWTWMCIQVDNGPQISIWDQQNDNKNDQQNNNENTNSYVGGQAFATILNLDDSLSVTSATIKELTSRTIPNTNRTYPNRWSVRIPGGTELTVRLLKDEQEINSNSAIPRIEGKCSVEEGEKVTGVAFVELCDLRPFFHSSETEPRNGKTDV